jgi:hypothetical protein
MPSLNSFWFREIYPKHCVIHLIRYLEEILSANPSDHPTIVLSQVLHSDLRLIVDFMYSGEVAVEQARLPRLLEAARMLKIKGLWDSGDGGAVKTEGSDGEEEEEEEIGRDNDKTAVPTSSIRHSLDSLLQQQQKAISSALMVKPAFVAPPPALTAKPLIGSQKRKKSKVRIFSYLDGVTRIRSG